MKRDESWRGVIRSNFRFDITSESSIDVPPDLIPPNTFRDPAMPFVLGEIARWLRASGYKVSEPKQAKGCYVVRISLSNLEILFMLSVLRNKDHASFHLWSLPRQRNRILLAALAEWQKLCDAIEKILVHDFNASSRSRMSDFDVYPHLRSRDNQEV
jgi:hypothetical protein